MANKNENQNSTVVNFFKKTLNDGRNVDCVRIYTTGDMGNAFEGMAKDYIAQYPTEWNNYINNCPDSIGTPLTNFKFRGDKLSVSSISSMNNIGIFTIEQLASIPSNFIFKLGISAKELVAEAKKFIEEIENSKKNNDDIQKIKKEVLSSLSKEDIMDALKHKENIEEPLVSEAIKENIEEDASKKRGRPSKQK